MNTRGIAKIIRTAGNIPVKNAVGKYCFLTAMASLMTMNVRQQRRTDYLEVEDMGFVHETGSKIFSMETRSESAYLGDASKDGHHLSIAYRRGFEVRDEICAKIMQQAGEHFAKGNTKEAERFKQMADIIRSTAISPDYPPSSMEATYEWIAALVKFCTTNKTVIGHLAELSTKED